MPNYTFTLKDDGSATYSVIYATVASDGTYVSPQSPAPTNMRLTLTRATTARLFQEVRSTDHFHSRCESKVKNVADTGAKTIEYTGPDGHATCTYNYTENKAVAAVTETFAGITTTIDMGRQLEHQHRYDRLALDAEMSLLVAAVKDRTALEIQVIGPTLHSIVDDGQVIERVRVAATKLLQLADMSR